MQLKGEKFGQPIRYQPIQDSNQLIENQDIKIVFWNNVTDFFDEKY